MQIPSIWTKAEGETETPDGRSLALRAWGWSSETLAAARAVAEERLGRLIDRVKRGEPFPNKYTYGSRPIREEIVDRIGNEVNPQAVLTRNRYGAVVLNAAHTLFLDVDVSDDGARPAGKKASGAESAALDKLRTALKGAGATFRIYRTAAGLRALAVDKEFAPESADTERLMKTAGTDPNFILLCKAQQSFRARLTPKPWRCEAPRPPGQFPREEYHEERFKEWLPEYENACQGFATCEYLETIGSGQTLASIAPIVELHDKMTRTNEKLPLA